MIKNLKNKQKFNSFIYNCLAYFEFIEDIFVLVSIKMFTSYEIHIKNISMSFMFNHDKSEIVK